ncbi:MAG: hypothetical protein LC704_00215 [Actinobacteria bacterium]|nr:hypothetical protein [Actinomycetota bacterium]
MLGPFYEPNAPERTSVGSGYVLSGSVLAAGGCEPVRDARIEFWLANPEGEYDDAHRATVFAGERGRYRFESNVPVSYGGRPPHIHIRVTAPGYRNLVTQHYPEAGQTEANFDLVLFLAPVFVPMNLLAGWLEAVARLNPFTTILDTARGFLAGEPTSALPAYAIAFALVLVFALWALLGLRSAERAG